MSFVLILLFGKRTPGKGAVIGITAVAAAFAFAIAMGIQAVMPTYLGYLLIREWRKGNL